MQLEIQNIAPTSKLFMQFIKINYQQVDFYAAVHYLM